MINKVRNPFKSANFASSIFISLFISFASIAAQNNAPQLTAAQWQADLRFLAEAMPKQHPNLFRRVKREDFEMAVKQLHDQIPSLNEDEISVGFMKIVAMVRDGHTSFFPRNFFTRGIYPFRF